MAITAKHICTIIGRDGSRSKHMLPIGRLPTLVKPSKYWIHDGYLYFHGPALWCSQYYQSEIARDYMHDVRINPWDVPDWKDTWPRYSNHHYYRDTVNHIFREKILLQNGDTIRTKHCSIGIK